MERAYSRETETRKEPTGGVQKDGKSLAGERQKDGKSLAGEIQKHGDRFTGTERAY